MAHRTSPQLLWADYSMYHSHNPKNLESRPSQPADSLAGAAFQSVVRANVHVCLNQFDR
jgi:hypothetical protein